MMGIYMKKLLTSLGMAGALALGAQPVLAQDIEAGVAAYAAGDYQAALAELRPLAEQGDADVQYVLGVMYYTGQGVAQDYGEAARLYR
ncbi:MAG: sel1 repeat family protein, partial [Pseudomonadota bacterium]